jgi:hypothetical protein
MTYMIEWKTKDHVKSVAKFQKEQAAIAPKGMTMLGSYHAVGQGNGFAIVQTDDPRLVHALTLRWAHVVDCKVTQVISDHEAIEAFESAGTTAG